MKKLVVITILGVEILFGGCIGSGSLKTCYDNNGNTYNVNKIGSSTYVNGSNSNTGSSWSSTSNRVGDTTYTTGTASNGNTWNSTSSKYGTYGTDSEGNSFYSH
ncbi:MAG: Unknown protein [uncultured Campylobacterales bacterium]|uniref:Uncharacterized protein n=1 Tax=uncultured Campylobacterales bacterium TaxID=352960 RepID=A0A6S6SCZ4_9BACT|nr:MAG: Unknown protein [uncultured Campylobacterales bacterium]